MIRNPFYQDEKYYKMTKMNILMIGATGTVGLSLAQQLADRNHRITCLVRKKTKQPFFHQCYEWSSTESSPPAQAFENISCIINLAGEPIVNKRWTPKQKKKIENSRVKLTQQLVQMAEKFPSIQTVINASAIGYYGDRQDEILDESSLGGRGFIPQLCLNWEKSALQFSGRSVVFRFGHVLCRHGGFLKKITPIFKWCLGGTLSSGKQWMSWVHIHDLHRIIVEAVENSHWEGVMNATSMHPVTNKEFTKTLSRVLNRPAPWIIPFWALKLLFGEMSEILVSSQRVVPSKIQKKGFIFKYSKIDEALKQIYLNTL